MMEIMNVMYVFGYSDIQYRNNEYGGDYHGGKTNTMYEDNEYKGDNENDWDNSHDGDNNSWPT